ncbi:DNA-protecting protein DprA [Vibrio parahaemolyticus]|uniref:DNA-processing protein DprA n=1 Tax=Vibrio parahaemolyticus TaxID=670 RepID=UPI002269F5E4|nr:DNA-processing protein DprA [Vibrio parahaemolyticus]MCX8800769.1 DNA-protecting protein DprA [Vibrio parahaemolyticus]
MISKSTKSLLAYRYLKGVGRKYLNDIAISAELSRISVDEAFSTGKMGTDKFSAEQLQQAFELAAEQIDIAESLGHTIISRLDEQYPDSLKNLPDAPPILFCAGDVSILKADSVTIIGTRSPTEHGVAIAQRITQWFSENNWSVTSGLAKGIDTVAHESCLEAKGKTIAVLAHGLEKIYPAQNKKLANEIVKQGGVLVTEYSYKSYIGRSNFVERDRIQAALAKAVVLVQSDLTGGSLHASRAILNYGRYLLVVGQSNRDVELREEKIAANMVLLFGESSEKMSLLKVSKDKLDMVLPLPNREHLEGVSNVIRNIVFNVKEAPSGENNRLF